MTQLPEGAWEGKSGWSSTSTAMYRYICSVWPSKRGRNGRVEVIRPRGRRGKSAER